MQLFLGGPMKLNINNEAAAAATVTATTTTSDITPHHWLSAK